MSSLTKLSAATMADLIRQKKISVVDLVDAHLRRIEQLNPHLNAFIHIRAEECRREAQAAQQTITRGNGDNIGSLHGVPVSIKSSIDVAGLPCETGSRLRTGNIAKADATLVRRLRAAGAIVLGNTNVPEMLMAYETNNRIYGVSNNPWDLERTPGGSSGGEAAAIAACISAAGVGSDGGGSVRIPAHFSGICALKPTPGRIPATGHYPQSLGPFAMLGVVGPMARTVADLELMFRAMAGPDPGDTSSVPVPLRSIDSDEAKKFQVGYFEEDPMCPVTPETREAVRSAALALERQGYKVVSFRPTMLEQARAFWWVLFGLTGAEVLNSMFRGHENEISPLLKQFLRYAEAPPLDKEKLLAAWFGRDQLRLQLLEEMEEIAVFLSPVCAVPAFRHGEREWEIGKEKVDYVRAMSYTQCFNLLGNPAAVLPISHSPEGLPIGVQVVGKPYEEEVVLKIAGAIEKDFGWKEPPWSQRVE